MLLALTCQAASRITRKFTKAKKKKNDDVHLEKKNDNLHAIKLMSPMKSSPHLYAGILVEKPFIELRQRSFPLFHFFPH